MAELGQGIALVEDGGGAKIYGALLLRLRCAAKSTPERIYRFNASDLRALGETSL